MITRKGLTMTGTMTITLAVPRQRLSDLLCTAVEGGSTSWATFSQSKRDDAADYLSVRLMERAASSTGDAPRCQTVTLTTMRLGMARLGAAAQAERFPSAGRHFAEALECGDAETADVVLQMAIFGEVVYG